MISFFPDFNESTIAAGLLKKMEEDSISFQWVDTEELFKYHQQSTDGNFEEKGWLLHRCAQRLAEKKGISMLCYSHDCLSCLENDYVKKCYMVHKKILPDSTPPLAWIVNEGDYVVLKQKIVTKIFASQKAA